MTKPLRVPLPHTINHNSLGRFNFQILCQTIPPRVEIDFSDLTFIRSCGVAYLGNFIEFLLHHGCAVNFNGLNSHDRDVIRYLDDAGFFSRYLHRTLSENANLRSTTFPIQAVRLAQVRPWIEADFIPWLSNRTGYPTRTLSGFQGVLSELYNNVADHTQFDIGCLFAQHHPNENRVLVAVADFGCGIPHNVRTIYPQIDDANAIIQAAELHFTTGGPTNFGVGLDQLLRQVVGLNNGSVTIRSQTGAVRFTADGLTISKRKIGYFGHCIGTMVEMSLPTNRPNWLGGDEGEENFEW